LLIIAENIKSYFLFYANEINIFAARFYLLQKMALKMTLKKDSPIYTIMLRNTIYNSKEDLPLK